MSAVAMLTISPYVMLILICLLVLIEQGARRARDEKRARGEDATPRFAGIVPRKLRERRERLQALPAPPLDPNAETTVAPPSVDGGRSEL